jgi:hypothetical protein
MSGIVIRFLEERFKFAQNSLLLARLILLKCCFFVLLCNLSAQDVLLAHYKFETDQQGWILQAYTDVGDPVSNPSSGWIAGVNWAGNGGASGCIRHNVPTGVGVWFGWSPEFSFTTGKQYYVKFGVTLAGANTDAINQRVQVRVGPASIGTNLNLTTIVMGSTRLPNTAVGPAGYVEYTSPLYTAPADGAYRIAVGDFFNAGAWACYYDGIRIYEVSSASTITTGPLAPTTYCPGQSVSVPFTVTGTFNTGNTFTLQLSDATGSFASPAEIGFLPGTGNGTVEGTIPPVQIVGNGYRVRVVSSNPAVTGTDNGQNIVVSSGPAIPVIQHKP